MLSIGGARGVDWFAVVDTVPLRELDDGELASRIANQPAAPAEEGELCRRFAPRVRLYGLRHLGNEATADDLVQRVLVLTILKLRAGEIREPGRIASFVLGAARTTCLEMRRVGAREIHHDPETLEVALPAVEPLPLARLGGCLDGLGERERTVIVLSFYEDQDAPTIARTLAIKEGHVRVIRHRSLERLRACLEGPAPHLEEALA